MLLALGLAELVFADGAGDEVEFEEAGGDGGVAADGEAGEAYAGIADGGDGGEWLVEGGGEVAAWFVPVVGGDVAGFGGVGGVATGVVVDGDEGGGAGVVGEEGAGVEVGV